MTFVVDTNTDSFTVNRDDVIRLAMQDCGQLGVGEQMAPEDVSYCADKLNMLVKQWQGTGDFAPGLKTWSRKRADLFLQTTKSVYLLGPEGDNWVTSGAWASTTLTAAAAQGALVINVVSTAGLSFGYTIGVYLDSGNTHWTSVAASTATTVTMSAGLLGAASIGATVTFYTNPARRPLQILTAILRDENNQDVPLSPLTLQEYEALPSKTDAQTNGDPYMYYYEAQLVNGVLYLDRFPNDTRKYLHVVYLAPVADINLATDTFDYPQQWFRALAAQLAVDIAPGFQIPISQELIALRNDAVAIARNFDGEVSALYFQPYADDYASTRSY